MSNEMISVPRELAELCMRNLNGGDNQLTGMEHGRAFRELRALLAKPAAQHLGKPVAIYQAEYRGDGGGGWSDVEYREFKAYLSNPEFNTRIVYTRPAEQLAPVAVVLPERLQQVLKFLEGAENLDGHWFGEPGPTGQIYWWRNELRKALAETNLFAKPL